MKSVNVKEYRVRHALLSPDRVSGRLHALHALAVRHHARVHARVARPRIRTLRVERLPATPPPEAPRS
jgi:hypothetical protein